MMLLPELKRVKHICVCTGAILHCTRRTARVLGGETADVASPMIRLLQIALLPRGNSRWPTPRAEFLLRAISCSLTLSRSAQRANQLISHATGSRLCSTTSRGDTSPARRVSRHSTTVSLLTTRSTDLVSVLGRRILCTQSQEEYEKLVDVIRLTGEPIAIRQSASSRR